MAQICNKMMNCFTSEYGPLADLEFVQHLNMSYAEVEADINEMDAKWELLEKETRSKITETVEYFSQFRENEPEESEFNSIAEKVSQFEVEFRDLYER